MEREKIHMKDKDKVQVPKEDDDDIHSFEIMKTPFERAIEGVPKVRIEVSMSIYLSRVRIDDLRNMHG